MARIRRAQTSSTQLPHYETATRLASNKYADSEDCIQVLEDEPIQPKKASRRDRPERTSKINVPNTPNEAPTTPSTQPPQAKRPYVDLILASAAAWRREQAALEALESSPSTPSRSQVPAKTPLQPAQHTPNSKRKRADSPEIAGTKRLKLGDETTASQTPLSPAASTHSSHEAPQDRDTTTSRGENIDSENNDTPRNAEQQSPPDTIVRPGAYLLQDDGIDLVEDDEPEQMEQEPEAEVEPPGSPTRPSSSASSSSALSSIPSFFRSCSAEHDAPTQTNPYVEFLEEHFTNLGVECGYLRIELKEFQKLLEERKSVEFLEEHFANLGVECEDLRRVLREFQELLQQRESTVGRLEVDLETSKSKQNTAEAAIAALEAKLETAESKNSTAEATIATLESTLAVAEAEKEEAAETARTLSMDLQKANERNTVANQKVGSLEEALAVKETSMATLQNKLGVAEKVRDRAVTDRSRATDTATQLTVDLRKLNERNTFVRQKVDSLEEELAVKETSIATLQDKLGVAERKRDSAAETIRQLIEELQKSTEDQAVARRRVSSVEEELAGKETHIWELHQKLEKRTSEYEAAEDRHKGWVECHQKEVHKLQTQIADVQPQLQECKTRLLFSEMRTLNLQTEVRGLQQVLDDSARRVLDLETQLHDRQKQLGASETRALNLQSQVQDLQAQAQDSRTQTQSLQIQARDAQILHETELSKASSLLKGTQEDLAKCEAGRKGLQQSLTESEAGRQELRDQLAQSKKDTADAISQSHQIQGELRQATDNLSRLSDLEAKYDESQRLVEERGRQLKESRLIAEDFRKRSEKNMKLKKEAELRQAAVRKGLERTISELETNTAFTVKERDALHSQIFGLQEERQCLEEELQTKLASAAEKHDKLQAQVWKDVEAHISRLVTALTSKGKECDALNTQVAGIQEQMQCLEGGLQMKLASAAEDNDALQGQISSLNDEKQCLEKELELTTSEMQAKLASAAEENGVLQIRVSGLHEEKQHLEKELEGTTTDLQAKLASAARMHDALQAQIAGLNDRKQLLEKKLEEAATELQWKLASGMELHEALRAQVSSLKDKKQGLEKDLEERDCQILVAESAKLRVTNQLDTANTTSKHWEARTRDLERLFKKAIDDLDVATTRVGRLDASLNKERLETTEERRGRLQAEAAVHELEEELQQCQDARDKTKQAQVDAIEAGVNDAKGITARLGQKMAELVAERDKAFKERDEMVKEHNGMLKERDQVLEQRDSVLNDFRERLARVDGNGVQQDRVALSVINELRWLVKSVRASGPLPDSGRTDQHWPTWQCSPDMRRDLGTDNLKWICRVITVLSETGICGSRMLGFAHNPILNALLQGWESARLTQASPPGQQSRIWSAPVMQAVQIFPMPYHGAGARPEQRTPWQGAQPPGPLPRNHQTQQQFLGQANSPRPQKVQLPPLTFQTQNIDGFH